MSGLQVFVAGQIGWDRQCKFVGDDFLSQARQALKNIVAVLAEGGRPEHITHMSWYVTDKREYLVAGRELGAAYREIMGKNFPAMTAIQVAALMEDQARVEIEATAVVTQ